jgi:hypothetical protein
MTCYRESPQKISLLLCIVLFKSGDNYFIFQYSVALVNDSIFRDSFEGATSYRQKVTPSRLPLNIE